MACLCINIKNSTMESNYLLYKFKKGRTSMKKIGVHLLSDKFRLIKKDPPLLQLPWLMSVGVVGLQFSVFLGS